MQLIISTPLTKTEYKIAWIELNTMSGNMIIQPAHAPMIMRLAPKSDVVIGLATGKKETVSIPQGVAHITRESVLLLVDNK